MRAAGCSTMGIRQFQDPERERLANALIINRLIDNVRDGGSILGLFVEPWRAPLNEIGTLNPSLIRNLGYVFWFGTPRVIEEGKTDAQLPPYSH
jgi:hypothetical protein